MIGKRCGQLMGAIALLLLLIGRGFFVPYRIEGGSMEPTLIGAAGEQTGEWVLVSRSAYWWKLPRRWDVVVFEATSDSGEQSVKRVVGLPGETIDIRDGHVEADGQPLELPPGVAPGRFSMRWPTLPLTLAADEVFVLGDNTYLSEDSRHNGPVAVATLRGRVLCVVLPWERRRSLATGDATGRPSEAGAPAHRDT